MIRSTGTCMSQKTGFFTHKFFSKNFQRQLLKKKQSKHICWDLENADMNLIQNENDGRGINSKILNMAIVASGPALLQGGDLCGGMTSRRSSGPDTPLTGNSSICFDYTPT